MAALSVYSYDHVSIIMHVWIATAHHTMLSIPLVIIMVFILSGAYVLFFCRCCVKNQLVDKQLARWIGLTYCP